MGAREATGSLARPYRVTFITARARNVGERHGRALQIGLSGVLVICLVVPVAVALRRDTLTQTSVQQPAGVSPSNLLGNPSFENDLRYWRTYAGTSLLRVTNVSRVGQAAAKLVAGGPSAAPFGAYTFALVDEPPARSRYSASLWVKGDRSTQGKKARIQLTEVGGRAAGTVIAAAETQLTGNWQLLRTRASLQRPDRSILGVVLTMEKTITLGATVYVDDVRLRGPA